MARVCHAKLTHNFVVPGGASGDRASFRVLLGDRGTGPGRGIVGGVTGVDTQMGDPARGRRGMAVGVTTVERDEMRRLRAANRLAP